jgi:hypothetical protein
VRRGAAVAESCGTFPLHLACLVVFRSLVGLGVRFLVALLYLLLARLELDSQILNDLGLSLVDLLLARQVVLQLLDLR